MNGATIDMADLDGLALLADECAPALTTAEWEEVCAKHSIPMAPVLELEHAHEDPYVSDGHLLEPVVHPTRTDPHDRYPGAVLRDTRFDPPSGPGTGPGHRRSPRRAVRPLNPTPLYLTERGEP